MGILVINVRTGDELRIGDAVVRLRSKRDLRGRSGNYAMLAVEAPRDVAIKHVRAADLDPGAPIPVETP